MSDVQVSHYHPDSREVAYVALADLEPFVRTLAGLDGPEFEDEDWESFVNVVTSGEDHLLHALPWTLGSVVRVDWKDSGEAFLQCQSICRSLGIGRLPMEYRPMPVNDIFVAFDDWLRLHDMACFELYTNADAYCAVVATSPADIQQAAVDIGVVLLQPKSTPEKHRGSTINVPVLPVNPAVAADAMTDLALAIERVQQDIDEGRVAPDPAAPSPTQSMCKHKVQMVRLRYSSGEAPEDLQPELACAIEDSLEAFEDPRQRLARVGLDVVGMARLFGLHDLVDRLGEGLARQSLGVRSFLIWEERWWQETQPPMRRGGTYSGFIDRIFDEPGDGPAALADYYDAWRDDLPSHYGFHDPERAYLGQWAFEVAAIAKMIGVDDSGLADRPMYPHDLAHFDG